MSEYSCPYNIAHDTFNKLQFIRKFILKKWLTQINPYDQSCAKMLPIYNWTTFLITNVPIDFVNKFNYMREKNKRDFDILNYDPSSLCWVLVLIMFMLSQVSSRVYKI